jgi:peptidoglycan/xylan/chitin deacetylase (PgdA/CDA1 family)
MRSLRVGALARKIGRLMHARPARIGWPGGVVSFTFDDFPKSARTVGAGVLESFGARGTYYVSLELAGIDRVVGPMFDHEDVRSAHRTGHEIACHTFSHPDCRGLTKSAIVAEVRNNAAAFSNLVEGYTLTNFAYPYGAVSPTAKRLLGPRFSTCRGVRPGINYGIIDLAELWAVAVYSSDFDQDKMERLIDQTRLAGGWLIFYTHDIVDTPSPFGCTPAQLEAVVAYAARRTKILPVRNVVTGLDAAGRA